MTRRTELLDAAITILGTQGVRGLTHRAVDTAAQAPQGSASNHFRTRDALITAVVGRVVERERAAFEEIARAAQPRDPGQLAVVLAEVAKTATGPNKHLTLARFAILVEAAIRPELRPRLAEGAAEVRRWGTAWLVASGSPDPARDLGVLANYLDAVTLHQLAQPDPHFDPTADLTGLIDLLVQNRPDRGEQHVLGERLLD